MTFPSPKHDHHACTQNIVSHAEKVCARTGARLTEQRRDVLVCVAESHQAVGAYEIIERMAAHGPRPAPITVYRALEFLQAQNLVHKIESRNAFVACSEVHDGAPAALLICESCNNVSEVLDRNAAAGLIDAAKVQGFTVKRSVVELSGICAHCRSA
ncbi:MAG: transcriptional repressor [Rhizobiales bacterium]|nr:transcriptional repressor [Hyphomicrobiales bacterium]